MQPVVTILAAWAMLGGVSAPDTQPSLGSDALFRAVPRDYLLSVFVNLPAAHRTDSSAPHESSLLQVATGVLYQLRAGGLLGESAETGSTVIDVLATASVLKHYPHAIVVTDAAAKRLDGGGHRLASLEGAIVACTGGDNDRIVRHIQQMLTARTTPEHSRIESRDEFDTTTYTVIDDRLPGWATIKWGAIGPYYCIALGPSAFDRVAGCILRGEPSVSRDESFLDRHQQLATGDTLLEWNIDLAAIRDRLRPVMAGRAGRVIDALGLGDADIGHWVVGRQGRFILAAAVFVTDGHAQYQSIASPPDPADPLTVRAIPGDAGTCTVIASSPQRVARRIVNGYLAAQRPKKRAVVQAAWDAFEKRAGIDVDKALLEPLGDTIIIHTYPPHPLKLPLLCTIMVPIHESANAYQAQLDLLMQQLDDWLAPADADGDDSHRGSLFSPRIRRTRQGYWYLQVGLVGPAIGVIDGWLVISHSPTALDAVAQWHESNTPARADSQP